MIERAIRSPCVTCPCAWLFVSQSVGRSVCGLVRKRTSTPLMPARMLMLLVQKVDSIDM